MPGPAQPITILVCALGGEGGGVLTEWLVEAARLAGLPVQGTSVPGVAQRTGSTTYYIEVYPHALDAGAKRPVFSLSPVPGAIDLLVSSELLETVRHIGLGMALANRTTIISASTRTLTTHERLHMGDGRVPSEPLLAAISRHSLEHQVFDMATLARESGTAVSAVMLGAIAASGVLPISRAQFERVIADDVRGTASMKGFAAAYGAITRQKESRDFVASAHAVGEAPQPDTTAAPTTGAKADFAEFPEAVRPTLALGFARMLDYQDERYARLYLDRVRTICAAEASQAGLALANDFATSRECARYLALWMAFDDIVRVADLKSRKSRLRRVRDEVKVKPGELLKVYDHFRPGIAEVAALLPEAVATRLRSWDRKRQARGAEAFAPALKIPLHGILGFASLKILSSLRWLRPHGSRYQEEQVLIEKWLAAVARGATSNWQLGQELALCGRLIKGYGSTNEQGKNHLLHIVDHLAAAAFFSGEEERALAVRDARVAALADDSGKALDVVLSSRGAPKTEVREIPIKFVRQRQPPKAEPAPAK